MLKLETGRRANNGDDNLVPLINIVFLMLIFFMVAGQISKSDAIKVEPPASISQQPLTETEPLDIIASAEGEIYIEDRALRLDQLQGDLQQRLAAVEDPDQLKVRVKTDARAAGQRAEKPAAGDPRRRSGTGLSGDPIGGDAATAFGGEP